MAYLSDIFKGNESGLHVGTLATFLKGKVPAGYLIPNGAEFSSLEYPELFTYLGSNKLPDLIDDESVPVGSIMPWISNSDIPNGWHHLGAQNAVEFTDARLYKFSEYPEFCNFINKARGVPLGQDALLEVLRFGETFRQVIRYVAHENHHDVTDVWDWQPDAIRRIAGEITCVTGDTGVILDKPSSTLRSFPVAGNIYNTGTQQNVLSTIISQQVAKDVRMTNRSVNYLIKVKPSKITKTTIAIKAAGRVSDEGLMQVEGIRKELDTFSHANLFINSDGWVNQRGVSAGHLTSNSSIYMRDRWFAHSGLGTPVEGEIVAYNTFWHEQMKMRVFQLNSWADVDSTYFFLAQNVEDLYFLAGLRDITISFKIFAINKPTGQFKIELRNVDDGSLKFDILMPAPSSSEWEYRKFTVPASEIAKVVNQDKPHLQIKFTDINETGRDAGFGIGEMKLELGSKATPFAPDDPATNLAKCQRYYWQEDGSISQYQSSALVPIETDFTRVIEITYPVTMRVPPALTYDLYQASLVPASCFYSASRCMLRCSAESARHVAYLKNIKADAEL